jgi:hypothetical protein
MITFSGAQTRKILFEGVIVAPKKTHRNRVILAGDEELTQGDPYLSRTRSPAAGNPPTRLR